MEFQTAKEIFTYFLGSHFQMSRENVLERYRSFQVTGEQEKEWRRELINAKTRELPKINVLSSFPQMLAHEAIPDLLRYTEHSDGFYQCRLAETLFDIVTQVLLTSFPGADRKWLEKAESTAKKTWQGLIKNPKQGNAYIFEGIDETIDAEFIRIRARTNLDRFEELAETLKKYKAIYPG
jgi:hypothetical protein